MKSDLLPEAHIPLTQMELGELAYQERRIFHAQRHALTELSGALQVIHKKQLYRGERRTFRQYCLERWGLRHTQVYRLLSAADILHLLTSVGEKLMPIHERQIRPFNGKPKEIVLKAWLKAVDLAGDSSQVREHHVKEAIAGATLQSGSHAAQKKESTPNVWQEKVIAGLLQGLSAARKGDLAETERLLRRTLVNLEFGALREHSFEVEA